MKKNLSVINVASKNFDHDYLKNIQKRMDCPACLETLYGELTLSRNKKTWKCDKCGYSLSDRKLAQGYIFWFCDECGKFLNNQKGFRKNAKRFVCKNCGFKNKLTKENIFEDIEDCLPYPNDFTNDMSLSEFFQKEIKIETVNGKVFIGKVGDYFEPEDNECGEESIVMDLDDSDSYPIEFYKKDIAQITVLFKFKQQKPPIPHSFTEKQIEFMYSLGLRMDFNNLSDDDWVKIEDTVADYLETKGFDKNYKPTKNGLMCESILNNLPV